MNEPHLQPSDTFSGSTIWPISTQYSWWPKLCVSLNAQHRHLSHGLCSRGDCSPGVGGPSFNRWSPTQSKKAPSSKRELLTYCLSWDPGHFLTSVWSLPALGWNSTHTTGSLEYLASNCRSWDFLISIMSWPNTLQSINHISLSPSLSLSLSLTHTQLASCILAFQTACKTMELNRIGRSWTDPTAQLW
jgi:hypothetical protein